MPYIYCFDIYTLSCICIVYSITLSILLISYISQNAFQQQQLKGHELAACSRGLRSGSNRAQCFPVKKLQMQQITEFMENLMYLLPLQRISFHMVVKCQYKMLRLKRNPWVISKCVRFLWHVRVVKSFLSSLIVAALETSQGVCICLIIHWNEKKTNTTKPQDAC